MRPLMKYESESEVIIKNVAQQSKCKRQVNCDDVADNEVFAPYSQPSLLTSSKPRCRSLVFFVVVVVVGLVLLPCAHLFFMCLAPEKTPQKHTKEGKTHMTMSSTTLALKIKVFSCQ